MGRAFTDSEIRQTLLDPESCCTGTDIKCEGDSVVELNWQFKGLTGSINYTASTLTSLRKWNISNNRLTGGFPSGLTASSIKEL